MNESRETYLSIIQEASRAGAAEMAKLLRPEEDRISKRQAEKEFTWAWVNRHIEQGLIVPQRSGDKKNSTMYFSRSALVSLQSSERIRETILRNQINNN